MYKLLVLLTFFIASTASAHPHSWISQNTRILGTDSHITGLSMVWSFDEQTTAYTLDGEDMSAAHRQKTLADLAHMILVHMTPSHYFTYFYDGDEPIRFYPVEKATLEVVDHKLIMRFDIELEKPVPFADQDLSLLIYDPSYYTDMFWDKPSDVSLAPALKGHCSIHIADPKPPAKMAVYASSLPPEVNPDFDLGELFAQRLKLRCKP